MLTLGTAAAADVPLQSVEGRLDSTALLVPAELRFVPTFT
jgi:hypothetical protein